MDVQPSVGSYFLSAHENLGQCLLRLIAAVEKSAVRLIVISLFLTALEIVSLSLPSAFSLQCIRQGFFFFFAFSDWLLEPVDDWITFRTCG